MTDVVIFFLQNIIVSSMTDQVYLWPVHLRPPEKVMI